MKIIKGQTALITGASKGIGVYIARALALKGMDLVLAARSASELELVRRDVEALGVTAIAVPTDVSDQKALDSLVDRAVHEFGSIDVLMNNAGIERVATYDRLSLEDIEHMIRVNLHAPMALTRMILPDMLARNRGHIVNMSSAAGVLPTSYNEPYSATKFGLVGFTRSLRLTLQETGSAVSASVICPGFLDDAGLYENMKQAHGVRVPWFLGSMKAEKAADAVVRAIENDLPDVLVMPGAPRMLMSLSAWFPRLAETITVKMGVCRVFRGTAEQRAQTSSGI